ncbi:MAG TPA: AMP-binding protein, partial [Ferruginibacter sp.]|nr:AMP-binding protein [Ferruginibacter sp.]
MIESNNNISLILKYWKKKTLNRENILKLQDRQNSLPSITIKGEKLNYFYKLTNNNLIAQVTVISAIYSFLLKKFIDEFDGYVGSNYNNLYNPLLLSFSIDLNTPFKEYLQKVKHEILESLKYSDYKIDDLYEKIGCNDLSILSHYYIDINSDDLDCNGVLFDVKISENEDIEINVFYLEGFVKKTIVENLLKHFKYFIVNLENNIASNLSEYQLITPEERQELLTGFNDTRADYPWDKTIIDLFERQADITPDNIAVVFEQEELTYRELNERANQLGRYLRE